MSLQDIYLKKYGGAEKTASAETEVKEEKQPEVEKVAEETQAEEPELTKEAADQMLEKALAALSEE